MLPWFRSHGELLRVGVEATGSYGAALTRHLALCGIPVLEVTGPDSSSRRSHGKDDSLDAISAARAAEMASRESSLPWLRRLEESGPVTSSTGMPQRARWRVRAAP